LVIAVEESLNQTQVRVSCWPWWLIFITYPGKYICHILRPAALPVDETHWAKGAFQLVGRQLEGMVGTPEKA
jgi:hypothetical protein